MTSLAPDFTYAVGLALLIVAVVAGVYLMVTPSAKVSLDRRRPADAQRSLLARVADGTSQIVGRLLGTRRARLSDVLDNAGLKVEARDLVILVISGALALGAMGTVFEGPLVGLLLSPLSPLAAVVLVVIQTGRRQRAFGAQLEETLQILAGSLRAGYSLPQAAATVAGEAEAPTSEEFARVINEARVGRPLVEAFEDSALRLHSDDFYWVIQAIAINREVGGNLADVLDGVSDTMRERAQLRRQVDSLSAEGKMSGVILTAIPLVVVLVLTFMNPKYIGRLFESALGWAIVIAGVVLLVIGALWMRVLVRIKY